MRVCAQRTIQELFEVCVPLEEPVFPVTAEEFVVLPQEPTVTETIAPKIARPFIEVRTEPARVLGEEPPLCSPTPGALLPGLSQLLAVQGPLLGSTPPPPPW